MTERDERTLRAVVRALVEEHGREAVIECIEEHARTDNAPPRKRRRRSISHAEAAKRAAALADPAALARERARRIVGDD